MAKKITWVQKLPLVLTAMADSGENDDISIVQPWFCTDYALVFHMAVNLSGYVAKLSVTFVWTYPTGDEHYTALQC